MASDEWREKTEKREETEDERGEDTAEYAEMRRETRRNAVKRGKTQRSSEKIER